MSVKGNNIFHTHAYKFLKSQSAIQRFSGTSLVLPAFIEERHNDIDSSSFASDSGDHSFQILEMIIRRHMIRPAGQGIRNIIIAYIHHQVEIFAADRLFQNSLCFA